MRPFVPGDAWAGTWAAPVPVTAQVQHTQQLVVDADGTQVVQVLTLRVPPSSGRDVTALFPPDSEVTYKATPSWVLAAREVLHGSSLVYLEVTTGDRAPDYGGWKATAVLHRSAGKNRWGNPQPATDVALGTVIIIPGDSTEPIDRNSSTVTTARLVVSSTAPTVASTDTLTVTGSPLDGTYQVTGDPAPGRGGIVVPLRKQ